MTTVSSFGDFGVVEIQKFSFDPPVFVVDSIHVAVQVGTE